MYCCPPLRTFLVQLIAFFARQSKILVSTTSHNRYIKIVFSSEFTLNNLCVECTIFAHHFGAPIWCRPEMLPHKLCNPFLLLL
ncbi:hypothetical protein CRG96_22670 [Escherichia sp. E4930]|nr:hypothetical protein CRG96_22670 [Escherichia sp. E4930]